MAKPWNKGEKNKPKLKSSAVFLQINHALEAMHRIDVAHFPGHQWTKWLVSKLNYFSSFLLQFLNIYRQTLQRVHGLCKFRRLAFLCSVSLRRPRFESTSLVINTACSSGNNVSAERMRFRPVFFLWTVEKHQHWKEQMENCLWENHDIYCKYICSGAVSSGQKYHACTAKAYDLLYWFWDVRFTYRYWRYKALLKVQTQQGQTRNK